jgi:monoamine oxidase
MYSGANVESLSAKHWIEDERPFDGEDHLILDGYSPIIQDLAKDVAIHLNTQALHIEYETNGVKVITNKGPFEADLAIITVPLGVLKSQQITFVPPLPDDKIQAIKRLKMGVFNKIALKFPHIFWPTDRQYFNYLALHSPASAWLYNYAFFFKAPVLVSFMGGESATAYEQLSDEALIKTLMEPLKALFGDKIPFPDAMVRTRWAQDPFSLGSYSYVPVGASGNDYDILSQPVGNKLFFAGEATSRQWPGMTHGAYLSGKREAMRIIELSHVSF